MTTFLNDDDVLAWKRDGFLIKEGFADAETLESLREAFTETLAMDSAGDRMLGGITRQIMVPHQAHPTFDKNPLIERGREVIGTLLGATDAVRVFDMLIYKPAGHPHSTPWHQDMSYTQFPFAPAGTRSTPGLVQFWVPLDDVDEENSCMQFIPGQHEEPLLPHYVAGGDPNDAGRLLAIEDPETHLDMSQRVVAKLPAGGVTMHGYGTPHYTGPNTTVDRARRAYIFNLAPVSSVEALIASAS